MYLILPSLTSKLKSLNLELIKESLPFDSIVSSPSIIYDCLLNNFDKFLIFDNNFNQIDNSILSVFNKRYMDLSNHTNNYGIYFCIIAYLQLLLYT